MAINKLTNEEKAYIAGFLDADGCIGITRKRSLSKAHEYDFCVRIIITNSYFPIIEWLKTTVGAGCAYHNKYRYKPTWSTVHRYQITNEVARELLQVLVPYLHVKKQRAELALELPTKATFYMQGGRTPEVYQKMLDVHAKMIALNDRSTVKNS